MTKEAVVKLYMHLTGGVDSGMNELDVLGYWRQHLGAGDKIINFAKIDPKNHMHVQQDTYLFGGVYLGFQVQKNCEKEFDAHKPWTPGPLTNDGHAVYAVAYDQSGVTVLTWGNTQRATWAWWGMSAWARRSQSCPCKPSRTALPKVSTSHSCRPTLPRWQADSQPPIVFFERATKGGFGGPPLGLVSERLNLRHPRIWTIHACAASTHGALGLSCQSALPMLKSLLPL